MKHYENRARAYLEQLRAGELDGIYADMTPEAAGQMPQGQLAQVWGSLRALAGAYRRTESCQAARQGELAVVQFVERYEHQKLEVSFCFDQQGRLAGLGLSVPPDLSGYQPEKTAEYEEIPVEVGEKALRGMLTLPRGGERPPVAVLIHGSGQSDMNEAVGGVRPFADLAHGLARRGVATLRYHKRFFQTKPDSPQITVEQEILWDAESAVDLARGDGRVDGGRVFVLGHSMGGMMAPKIASDRPVRGIISLAGTPTRLETILLEQNQEMLRLDPRPEAEKRKILEDLAREARRIPTLTQADRQGTAMGQPASYWLSLNAIDVPALVRELDIPMLFLQGENDFQVTVERDFAQWKRLLEGRPNAAFRLYPGLSHLFTQAPDRAFDLAQYSRPAQVEPRVIDDVAEWIKSIG